MFDFFTSNKNISLILTHLIASFVFHMVVRDCKSFKGKENIALVKS